MAQKAKKDRAKANIASLNNLHIGSLSVNAVFLLFNFLISRRSLTPYLIISLPSFIAEYFLEISGRPKFDPETRALRSAGDDLAAEGLTEYMFDVIWVTWACAVVVIGVGNWGWLLWAIVPIFGAWKGYALLGAAKGMMSGQQGVPEEQMAAGAGNRRQRRAA